MDLSKTVVIVYGCSSTVAYIMKRGKRFVSCIEDGCLKSTVSYHNSKVHVGCNQISCRKNEIVLHSTKQLLGISYQEYSKSKLATYDFGCAVECNFDNKPCFRLDDSVTLTSEDIASIIIGRACETAMKFLPELENVVVTVPASFSRKQKEALVSAITMAGYRCSMTISEPAAAVIYYASTKNISPSMYCVLDLGACSSKISIVNYGKEGIEVLKTTECTFLCGDAVISKVLLWLQNELVKRGVDSYENLTKERYPQMLSRCEEMIRELSYMEESFFDPRILSKSVPSFPLSQSTLKELLHDDSTFLLQQIDLMRKSPSEKYISTVLVVGSLAQSQVIQELLEPSFQFPSSASCIADGCITYLNSLTSSQPYTILRRLDYDVGIGVSGNNVRVLMERGSLIPYKKQIMIQTDKESDVVQTGIFVRDCERDDWALAEMLIFYVDNLYWIDSKLKLLLEVNEFGVARIAVTDSLGKIIFNKDLLSVLCCCVCSTSSEIY